MLEQKTNVYLVKDNILKLAIVVKPQAKLTFDMLAFDFNI